jgi:hypothetical protein
MVDVVVVGTVVVCVVIDVTVVGTAMVDVVVVGTVVVCVVIDVTVVGTAMVDVVVVGTVVVCVVIDVTVVGTVVVVLQLAVFHIADPWTDVAKQDRAANRVRLIISAISRGLDCNSRSTTEAQPN